MISNLKSLIKILLILSMAIVVSPVFEKSASANGQMIIPNPPMPRPQFRPLILERQEIKTSIDGQVAKTHIKQVWRNNNNMMLEGEFLFPLPTDRATMSDFVLWMDGKKLNFETMEAGKARGIYEDIVRRMRDPGLLEYAGDGLLRCRIYPIPANGVKEIELEYREVMSKEGSLSRYAFPLAIKGLPEPIGTVLIDVDIVSSSPMGRVYSPTHDVSIDMRDSLHARVTMEKSYYSPSGEFVLFISKPQSEFGVDLVTHKPSGDDGYFLGLISPRFDYDTSNQKAIPKNFLFILDTSGSMEGEKIVQAKDALRYILKNLNTEDKFSIINFSSEVHKFSEQLESVSKVNEALKYVDTLVAAGGTFIDGALKDGLSYKGYQDRPFYIVFLTDGLPTIGEQNIDTILTNVAKANERKARVFSFGVGDDVNIGFIDKLARENGGVATNVAPSENLEVPVSELYQKIKSPVLTNLKLDISGVSTFDVYPKNLPDLFKGSQLIVTGCFKGSGNATAKLTGNLGGSDVKTMSYSLNFNSQCENNYIPPLWANRKVGYLLNEIRLYGENQETVDQIIRLAKQYGIITPYTSYLVLEDSNMPMPMPVWEGGVRGSVNTLGDFSGSAPAAARSESKMMRAKEEAESLDEVKKGADKDAEDKVQHVKDKTFVLRDGIWVDTEFNADDKLPEVAITFMSDDYFELIKNDQDLGDYFSIGENVKLVWKGKVYIVKP